MALNSSDAKADGVQLSERKAVAPPGYAFSPEVVMLSDPRGARAESIRALRTHIMARHVSDGRRGLAICAATEGVGATFTAVNLAVSLSQIGTKVLLIDGDLRNPAVNDFIRPADDVVGLRQCLETAGGQATFIQSDVLENLSIMYSGGQSGQAQELLASENFALLIERCLRDFDITIVDTPSASSSADARRISNVVGYGLIVARRHESYVSDIAALGGQLTDDRATIVGTVMTEA
ncbi:MAG TPA: CpsD/CapB family tyrosine-protein kinase [Phenylobacterium sp.]|uniref:CpsD/CapB family tyrosine-protein kinase n=1 Tax=Phenylobacterium sp. TaxID=1871053 RepID=UPI002F950AD0